MNAFGHFLGQLIGLALIPAALVWVLRGTRPGRVVWRAFADLVRLPAQRRRLAEQRAIHQRYSMWRESCAWWAAERDNAPEGSHRRDAATDMLAYFQLNSPPLCTCRTCLPRYPRSR